MPRIEGECKNRGVFITQLATGMQRKLQAEARAYLLRKKKVIDSGLVQRVLSSEGWVVKWH